MCLTFILERTVFITAALLHQCPILTNDSFRDISLQFQEFMNQLYPDMARMSVVLEFRQFLSLAGLQTYAKRYCGDDTCFIEPIDVDQVRELLGKPLPKVIDQNLLDHLHDRENKLPFPKHTFFPWYEIVARSGRNAFGHAEPVTRSIHTSLVCKVLFNMLKRFWFYDSTLLCNTTYSVRVLKFQNISNLKLPLTSQMVSLKLMYNAWQLA